MALGIDNDARPFFDEVLTVLAGRRATIDAILARLTDDDMTRRCSRNPAPE
jgi:hypothetical protein